MAEVFGYADELLTDMSRRNSDNRRVQHDGQGTQLVVGERVKKKALAQGDDRT